MNYPEYKKKMIKAKVLYTLLTFSINLFENCLRFLLRIKEPKELKKDAN